MNELELLKEFRAQDATPPGRADVDGAWTAVRSCIESPQGPVVLRPRRVRRWALAAAVAAAVAALLLAVSVVLPSGSPGGARRAAAAVSFRQDGEYIVAIVKDVQADSETLKEAFAQHGLDISLQLLPVSPSFVGKFVELDTSSDASGIETLFDDQADCSAPGSTSCPIGLKIPVDFSGQANITLGRAGQPGEEYASVNDAFASGEALHCSGVRGMTVQDAIPVLNRLGVTVIWRSNDESIDKVDGIDPSTILDQYVTDGVARSLGEVYVWAAPEPSPEPQPGTPLADYYARLDRGC